MGVVILYLTGLKNSALIVCPSRCGKRKAVFSITCEVIESIQLNEHTGRTLKGTAVKKPHLYFALLTGSLGPTLQFISGGEKA